MVMVMVVFLVVLMVLTREHPLLRQPHPYKTQMSCSSSHKDYYYR